MKTLYTQKEFNSSNSTDKLPCKCYFCNKTFYIKKGYIKHEIKSNKGEVKYCSKTCKTEDRKNQKTIFALILAMPHTITNTNLMAPEGQKLRFG